MLNVNRTSRNWRYHKELMMWVTKDQNLPDPIPISAEAEKGSYVFFNHNTWNRVRVSNILHNGERIDVQPSSLYTNLELFIPVGNYAD